MRFKFSVIFVFVVLFSSESFSQSLTSFLDKADTFFATYVSEGNVAYDKIHKHPEDLLSILEIAKNTKVAASEAKQYQAFWINAYNLAVIKGIIDVYPTASPLDTKGFFDTKTYSLGGTEITLNDIENKKLRAVFKDPRFHFVLVCGAKGCPPLLSEAYTPSKVEAQLQHQTEIALNNPTFIKVTEGSVAFSEIFKWYKEDFVGNGQTEIDFLNTYRNQKVPVTASVTYYPYNWKLNAQN
ncbi:DUF547 domain-containing protein [Ulvibacter litoralis]|uniref:DUF547 domain-containing protein n=1 Tax=Ulvibacter litoralis TaxID=227084 RepID=A0A1G7CHY8_9FLAO|nr:DUF547 domain-containing protein [Ulvibacter litoralis]GHC47299.1 hypothetical protein GCM10008083_08120 [Ulvibacter litoralis]SDE38909.1 Protein of unknown function, DUF547 [Ulvibacter litoralis]